MKCRARARRFCFGIPLISSGNATFSTTVRQGKVDSSWNTMPMAACGPLIGAPAIVTRPWKLSINPPMMLNRVDLPQPDGPMIDTNSPSRTAKAMRSSAASEPSGVRNSLARPSTTRSGSDSGAAAADGCEGEKPVGTARCAAILALEPARAGKPPHQGVRPDRQHEHGRQQGIHARHVEGRVGLDDQITKATVRELGLGQQRSGDGDAKTEPRAVHDRPPHGGKVDPRQHLQGRRAEAAADTDEHTVD